jgi:hypothetical protein
MNERRGERDEELQADEDREKRRKSKAEEDIDR